MSCNLFSDLVGTNIRSHRWTKPSLRATATAYQKHWEPSKKAEIGWFCRKETSNFSWGMIWYDLFPSKNSSCQRVSPWREIQQPNSEILVESLQESSIRSFIIWNGTSQIITKNTKTPGPSKKTFSLIQNKEILKKLNIKIQNIISNWNSARQQIFGKRNWNELQIVFRSWWYEHQESQMDKTITPSNSNCVPKIESHQRRLRLVGSAASRPPTFFLRSKVWYDFSHQKTVLVRDFRHDERFNNQIKKSWWKVFTSLALEASTFETAAHKLSPKIRKLPVQARRPFHWFKTKKSSRSWISRSKTSFRTGIPRDSKFLGKETETSCKLFSDLGGTNIRSHRWTKPSLRATATAYQKHWEPSKKAEISWFCHKATSNFFLRSKVWYDFSHQKTVLVRDFRHDERFNNQIKKSWWKVFRSLVLEASSFETSPHKLSPKIRKLQVQARRLFHRFKTKKSSRSWIPRSKTSFQTGIPRDSKYSEKKLKWAATCFHILVVRTSGNTDGQNHHYEQQQLSTKKYESHQRKLRLVGSDARRHPTFHARETLAWLVYTNWQFSSRIRAFDHDWTNQQPVSEYFVGVSRSIILEASSFKTTPRKLISKKNEKLVPKKQDHLIDTKQRSPQKVENQRSIISFRTGILRDSKF